MNTKQAGSSSMHARARREEATSREALARIAGSIGRVLFHVFLVAGASLSVFPFLWTISASFKNTTEIFRYPPDLIPPVLRVSNYTDLFALERVHFARWYLNSAVVAVCSVTLSLFFSSLGGFGFAKYEFRFRGLLFAILLGSMMVPFYSILIPLFVMMVRIQWVDTYHGLILPFSAGAFGVFLMRQYIVSLPDELLDAARIDGATEFRIYYQIILPLSKPALGTLAVLGFMGSWNSFTWPLIILRSAEKFTLPLGMANLLGTWMGERLWGPVMAGSVLSVLPILVLFMLMQRQFIAGMIAGGCARMS